MYEIQVKFTHKYIYVYIYIYMLMQTKLTTFFVFYTFFFSLLVNNFGIRFQYSPFNCVR